jgi:DNA-binding protein YbaB
MSSHDLSTNPAPTTDATKDELLKNIQGSMGALQERMQQTYQTLTETLIQGQSLDASVRIKMTATYTFEDIEFDRSALADGMKEFKWRIREAFRDVIKNIQENTQKQTMELLQNMEIPEEIRAISGGTDEGTAG